jgi:hypothetical protein
MARLLSLQMDFLDVPPGGGAFAGDFFERRAIDELDKTRR